MSEDTANPAPLPVQRLRRPTATRLRSSLVVPSIAQVLNELVQNALDAGAQRIECWINLVSGNETVRVEDDGDGVRLEDLDQVGERNGRCLPSPARCSAFLPFVLVGATDNK